MTRFIELTLLNDSKAEEVIRQLNTVSVDSVKRVMKWTSGDGRLANRCKVTVVIGNQTHEWHVEGSYETITGLLSYAGDSMAKNCIRCGKPLTEPERKQAGVDLGSDCQGEQVLGSVPEQCRICLMCHCRKHARVLATLVSRSVDGLEWFECANHGPTENIAGAIRVSSEPIQHWIHRNLEKPAPSVNKASDHIEPGALCCKCHKEPATFATRLVTRDDTMPFDALLWGGATCWDCAKTMARRLDIGPAGET